MKISVTIFTIATRVGIILGIVWINLRFIFDWRGNERKTFCSLIECPWDKLAHRTESDQSYLGLATALMNKTGQLREGNHTRLVLNLILPTSSTVVLSSLFRWLRPSVSLSSSNSVIVERLKELSTSWIAFWWSSRVRQRNSKRKMNGREQGWRTESNPL